MRKVEETRRGAHNVAGGGDRIGTVSVEEIRRFSTRQVQEERRMLIEKGRRIADTEEVIRQKGRNVTAAASRIVTAAM